MRINI